MIDFRFHLISLVAVFLALGLGILMGSVVLDQQLVNALEGDLKSLRADKQALQEDVITLERQLDADVRFAEVTEEWLLRGTLEGQDVILLRFSGTDDRVVDGVREAIEKAGGRIPSMVTLTERLSLPGVVERDQLALAVESTSGEAAELRIDAGDFLGSRLGSAVSSGEREGRVDAADNAAVNLLTELEEAGFAELDGVEEGRRIPDAYLVLVGGSEDPRPFNLTGFGPAFAEGASARGATVLVAESSASDWGLVDSVRSNEIEDEIVTVDHAETVAGRIAVALALRDAAAGVMGHYGTGPGSSEIIPRPLSER